MYQEADLNFSLMPAIEALLRPDDEDVPKPRKATQSCYRRPGRGRGHNQDFCLACDDVGDLICCDQCPSSFHLECHDPPLSEAEVPQGQWLCRSCKMAAKVVRPLVKSGSVDSRMELTAEGRPLTPIPVDRESLIQGMARKIFPKRSSSVLICPSTQRLSLSVENKTSADTLISPWDQLVKAASSCNPKKFDLPREMCGDVFQLFPGDDKGELRQGKKNGRGGGGGNGSGNGNGGNGSGNSAGSRGKAQGEQPSTSSGTPLPSKLCFSCRKSCRKAPLISCDFCPLFFHQDCLDPPMTALPTTMWMCPVHPHQITDWKNISSMAATERVKLWSKFNPAVDQDTVKAQFLRRVHSDRLRTRFKLKPQARDRAQVPAMVQYYYKNPQPMRTSLKHLHRVRELEQRERIFKALDGNEDDDGDDPKVVDPADEDLEMIQLIDEDIKGLKEANEKQKLAKWEDDNGTVEEEIKVDLLKGDVEMVVDTDSVQPPLLLALQEKVNAGDGNLSEIFRMYQEEGKLTDLLKEIQNSVKGGEDIEIKSEKAMPNKCKKNENSSRHIKRPGEHERIQSRAVLTPIYGNPMDTYPPRPLLELATQMRYRKLSIGTLHSNDLRLEGECRQQSEKHAIVFYDDYSRTFELINYSEHGTDVNGQLYALNLGMAKKKEVISLPAGKKKMMTHHVDVREIVTEIIDRKRGIKRIKYGELDKGTEMAAPEPNQNQFCNCNCTRRSPLAAAVGWEGSAVLSHGHVLTFGCQSFVFSIPDPFDEDEYLGSR